MLEELRAAECEVSLRNATFVFKMYPQDPKRPLLVLAEEAGPIGEGRCRLER
jgi:hypothetical protein